MWAQKARSAISTHRQDPERLSDTSIRLLKGAEETVLYLNRFCPIPNYKLDKCTQESDCFHCTKYKVFTPYNNIVIITPMQWDEGNICSDGSVYVKLKLTSEKSICATEIVKNAYDLDYFGSSDTCCTEITRFDIDLTRTTATRLALHVFFNHY